MLDKGKFMELLKDLMEIAQTQENVLSQKEIKAYLKDTELDESSYEAIYAYLAENRILVEGFRPVSAQAEDEPLKEEDSVFLKMYLKELKGLEKLSVEEEELLFCEVMKGQDAAKERLIHAWLPKVVKLAKKYKNQGVYLEDLIQEGNIGLLAGVEALSELEDKVDAADYLKKAVCLAIEQMIDEAAGEGDMEDALVGRSNLIREAANRLAEDMGRSATMEELAKYTRLSMEEITDILMLSKEKH